MARRRRCAEFGAAKFADESPELLLIFCEGGGALDNALLEPLVGLAELVLKSLALGFVAEDLGESGESAAVVAPWRS